MSAPRPWLLPLLACLALLAPAPRAAAQAAAVDARGPTRGAVLPPTGAALADEATAPEINPAGLGMLRAAQLFYLHERNLRLQTVADALFAGADLFGLDVGLALQWVRPAGGASYRKTSWTLAAGGPSAALGLTYNLFGSSDDDSLDHLGSLDAGLLVRPTPFLSAGVAAQSLAASTLHGQKLPVRWDLGLGLRPFGQRLTLGGDLLADSGSGLRSARLSFAASVEPVDGVVVQAGLAVGLRGGEAVGQLALTLNAPNAGATYAVGSTREADALDHLIALRASADRYPGARLLPARYVLLDVPRALSPSRGPLGALLGARPREPFLELLSTLRRIEADPSVAGVVLQLDALDGLGAGRTEELRAAVLRLRGAGKRAAALLVSAGDREYRVAAACERLFAVPQATFEVNGFAASTLYFAEALDRLGVQVDVAKVGAFKSAPDALTRTSMSPEEREVLTGLLDQIYARLVEEIAQARSLPPDQVRRAIDEGILGAGAARRAGLLDEVLYPDELPKAIEGLAGRKVELARDYPGPTERPRAWGRRAKVAVVVVEGLIAEGKSRGDLFGAGRVAGAETVVQALERAREDPAVGAVVLRVDSPGGSGPASDLIWRAVRRLREKKPVVASMGDTAASGGYYAAMAADEIVAEPSTITGSIGVFSLKPNFGGLLEKVGVHREVLARGEKADLLSVARGWTRGEQEAMQRYVEEFYDGFIARVAECRGIPKARVDELARGRVYSGADAQRLGLVDALGGLAEAVAAAGRRAKLGGGPVEVEVLGGEGGWRGLPLAAEAPEGIASQLAREVLPLAAAVMELPEAPLAMLPWQLTLR